MKKKLLGKVDKIAVNLTVCFYALPNDAERYVFFFYSPIKDEPVYKWIYYLEAGKGDDLKQKFQDVLREQNFKVNRSVTLCMCNKETKINRIKLPKTLGFSFKYKKIIEADLKDKFGEDVKEMYYIDNKIDGEEENGALKEGRSSKKYAYAEDKKVAKLRKKLIDQEKEKEFVCPRQYTKYQKFTNYFSLVGGYLLISFAIYVVFTNFNSFHFPIALAFVASGALYLVLFFIFDIIKTRQIPKEERKKDKFYARDYFDFLAIVLSLGIVALTEHLMLETFSSGISLLTSMLYFTIVIVFLLYSFVWLSFRSMYPSKTYQSLGSFLKMNRKDKEPKEDNQLDKEFYLEGVTPKKKFNISEKKTTIFKRKENKVVSFRQLLVSRFSYKCATFALKTLGLVPSDVRTLPSVINQFHLKYAKGVNEIIVYNEAGFTLFVGIVNDRIVDSVFVEGSEKTKNKDGKHYVLHLQSFYNVFSSLLWSCQRESIRMDRVVYFANSPKKIEELRKEKVFGLPFVVVPSTDALFGSKPERTIVSRIKSAFTLIETVVALAVFLITAAMVAILAVSITNTNEFTTDQNKANVYLNNVREVFRANPSNETFTYLTTASLGESETTKQVTYYVDHNFALDTASASSTNRSYVVVAEIGRLTYTGGLQDFTTYSLKVNSIQRISSSKNLVDQTLFEVSK